ncbi:hypothetical protein OCA5_c16450 [Afipia carboxidovorans OM5]|uniref:Uncharacterized protein n=1 Tax=Afipia carboxidovorans (strain ATCC 49405 / DSM 1227 / KCTC 32145 / OM5) TaxID=504832 RepID=F8C0I3_AFIC5|nr:hypothetical protein OCA4_c16450 [Afipia carboxidovorans OM4]AEI06359.1 hypothetical protein OCA5_c16450 [Afipia carboxidovorans OM5]
MRGVGAPLFPLDRLLSGYSVESSIQFFSPRLLNPTGDPSKLFATDFPAENHVLALNVVSESIGNDRAIIDASNTRTDAR